MCDYGHFLSPNVQALELIPASFIFQAPSICCNPYCQWYQRRSYYKNEQSIFPVFYNNMFFDSN